MCMFSKCPRCILRTGTFGECHIKMQSHPLMKQSQGSGSSDLKSDDSLTGVAKVRAVAVYPDRTLEPPEMLL